MAAQSQPSKILKISLGKQDRGVETTGLDNGIGEDQALRDLSRNNRPVQGRRDTLVYHAEKVVDSFNEFVEAVSSQEKLAFQAQAKVERLQKANKEQAQEIADLKATISRLQVQTVNQHTSRTVLPAQEIDIEPDRFETIPPEVDNGGMLREQKARPVEVGGKEYEERIFLLECKLQVSGHLTGETVKHDGVSFTQIMEGNVEKLVQNLGPSSLVQCDGRQFLRWVTLKEKRFYGI